MIKKNKGFTLIELLAVIVITGVLTTLIIPKISNMVLETRLKIYLQDAKKMISQVQYKMSSNTVGIEKPEIGECIVFSLGYLGGNELKTGPNEGVYIADSSFVVVKNEDGVLDYAVMLVESRKDGLYQGVEFVTESILNATDAVKHVRYFDSYDIRAVPSETEDEEDTGKRYLDTDYINEQLARAGVGTIKWVEDDSIARAYTTQGEDPEIISDASSPRITAKVVSKDSGGTGLTEATLTVNATDADDALNTLKVCTRISTVDDNKFPNLTSTPELCEDYGELNFYSKDIDFKDYGLDYENNTIGYVYITVVDPSGHTARKLREYNVHKNDGPQIKDMEITKLNNHNVNMPIAQVKVDIVDDINDNRELEICFDQDYESSSGVCSSIYREYNFYFKDGGTYKYNFKNINGEDIIVPDGSTHSLTMYVRDKEGKISVRTAQYKLHKNEPPNVKIDLLQEELRDKETNQSLNAFSLNYSLLLEVTDDISDPDHIMVQIADYAPMTYQEYLKNYYLNEDYFERFMFKASGELDGQPREIPVKVWDEYQQSYDVMPQIVVLDNIFVNKPPSVKSFRIYGNENICMNGGYQKYCLASGSKDGSYAVRLKLLLDKDGASNTDIGNNTKVCFSEKKEDCVYNSANSGHFVYFSDFEKYNNNRYSFAEAKDKYVSTNDIRNLYLNVVEVDNSSSNEASYAVSQPYPYQIYANKSPEFVSSNYIITPTTAEAADTVYIDAEKVQVTDDFNAFTMQFCYRKVVDVSDNTTPFTCTGGGMTMEQFRKEFNGEKEFKFKDNDGTPIVAFQGELIETFFRAKDHKGLITDSKHQNYELYNENAPKFASQDYPLFRGQSFHDNEYGGSNTFGVQVRIYDVNDIYKVCIKPKVNDFTQCEPEDYVYPDKDPNFNVYQAGTTKNNTKTYTISVDGVAEYGWDKNYKEKNPDKSFIVSAMDSTGLTTDTRTVDYKLYNACSIEPYRNQIITDSPVDDAISVRSCGGKCYHSLGGLNDTVFELPNNDIEKEYTRIFSGDDHYIENRTCTRKERISKNCSEMACINAAWSTIGDQLTFDNNIYISLKREEVGEPWPATDPFEKRTVITYEDKTCPDLIEDSKADSDSNYETDKNKLFSSIDYRCGEVKKYCTAIAKMKADGATSGTEYTKWYGKCTTLMNDKYCKLESKVTLKYMGESLAKVLKALRDEYIAANGENNVPSDDTLKSNLVVKHCDYTTDEFEVLNSCLSNVSLCAKRDEIEKWYEKYDTVYKTTYTDHNCTQIKKGDCKTWYQKGYCEQNKDKTYTCKVPTTSVDESSCPDAYKKNGKCVPVCDASNNYNQKMTLQCRFATSKELLNYTRNCRTRIYKKYNCTQSSHDEDMYVPCNSKYYAYYRATPSNKNVVALRKISNVYYCPELLEKYFDKFTYDDAGGIYKYISFIDKSFILFNPDDFKDYSNFSIKK